MEDLFHVKIMEYFIRCAIIRQNNIQQHAKYIIILLKNWDKKIKLLEALNQKLLLENGLLHIAIQGN